MNQRQSTLLSVPNKYFSIDGVATFVQHSGTTTLPGVVPDTQAGETVVCLHDIGGNGAEFRGLLDGLEGAHSPFAFDFPGHSRSGELDSLGSIARMAEFLGEFCSVLGLERPVLLGHGMGAAVALQYALSSPASVRALVPSAGAARFDIPDDRVQGLRRLTEGKAQRQFDRSIYSPATGPEIMRACFMESVKTDPRVAYGDLLACKDWDRTADLGGLDLPVLIVWGEDAQDTSKQDSVLLAERISGAKKLEIPKAGHALLHEQPAALVDGVSGFLSELQT